MLRRSLPLVDDGSDFRGIHQGTRQVVDYLFKLSDQW